MAINRLLIVVCAFLVLVSCTIDTGLEPTQSGFSGTIRFSGPWPESTDQVMVVAATKFPPSNIQEIVQGEPLPKFVDSTDYVIYTPPEKFEAVGVVWKQKGQSWDVTNIIGIYFPTADHFNPGRIEIPDRKTMVNNIDVVADFKYAKPFVTSSISGKLVATGTWPAGAKSVLVVASKSFVPNSLLDISLSLPIAAPFDTTNYTFTIQPGTYSLVGCLVPIENVPIGFESIKGFYYQKPTDFLPGKVVVPTDSSQISNINITINF